MFRMFLFLMVLIPTIPALAQRVSLPSGGSIVFVKDRSSIQLKNAAGKSMGLLRLDRDGTVPPNAAPDSITLIAEKSDSYVIFVDKYRSLTGGLAMCQSGEESFLRVVAVSKDTPVESLRIKLESCIDNIELASQGIEWQPSPAKLSVSWLSGPSLTKGPENVTFSIGGM